MRRNTSPQQCSNKDDATDGGVHPNELPVWLPDKHVFVSKKRDPELPLQVDAVLWSTHIAEMVFNAGTQAVERPVHPFDNHRLEQHPVAFLKARKKRAVQVAEHAAAGPGDSRVEKQADLAEFGVVELRDAGGSSCERNRRSPGGWSAGRLGSHVVRRKVAELRIQRLSDAVYCNIVSSVRTRVFQGETEKTIL
jgi:hypothetical protein